MIAYCWHGMNHYLDENYQVGLEYLKNPETFQVGLG